MFKMALIGKNIGHSKSPIYYSSSFSNISSYDLLDFSDESMLPSIENLKNNYRAINVTSPFKRYYSSHPGIVFLTPSNINSLNLLLFSENQVFAANTDYLALSELLAFYTKNFDHFCILGDGVMSDVIQVILNSSKKSFTIHSRKLNSQFINLDFSQDYSSKTLFINTCTRGILPGSCFPVGATCFDVNYDNTEFRDHISNLKVSYIDGIELFNLQANFVVQLIRKYLSKVI